MEHNDGTVGIVFKIVTFKKSPQTWKKKDLKKTTKRGSKQKAYRSDVGSSKKLTYHCI